MSWWGFLVAFVGGAGLGTVLGRLLDLWFVEPRQASRAKERWLREARLDAFAKLAEELNSVGFHSGVSDDPLRFKAIAARAELLIPDSALAEEIHRFVDSAYAMHQADGKGFKLGDKEIEPGSPEDKSVMKVLGTNDPEWRVHLQKGTWLEELDKRASKIVARLGELVRDGV